MSVDQVIRSLDRKRKQLSTVMNDIGKLNKKSIKKPLSAIENTRLKNLYNKQTTLMKEIATLEEKKNKLNLKQMKEQQKLMAQQQKINSMPRVQETVINNNISIGDINNSNVAIQGDLYINNSDNKIIEELTKISNSIECTSEEVSLIKDHLEKFIAAGDVSDTGINKFKETISSLGVATTSNIIATMFCQGIMNVLG